MRGLSGREMTRLQFCANGNTGPRFWYITILFLGIAQLSAFAWCPPEESHKQQDQFFKCVRTMDAADQNGDDRLDYNEFQNYVRYLALTLYTVPLFKDGLMPQDFDGESLFGALVEAGGNAMDENGYSQIDIYGSNIEDVSDVSNVVILDADGSITTSQI